MKTNDMPQTRTAESGNVLFLILIAVALFAALSYAVTQSTRSGGGDASNETGLINSAQLTQYPAGVRTAVVRMIISGVDADDLAFNAPSDFGDLTGGGGTTAQGVFHPAGGGGTYVNAPADVMDAGGPGTWVFNGENQINLIGVTAAPVDATSADIIGFLPDVSLGVCNRINEELGLPATPPAEADADYVTQMVNDGSGPVGIMSDTNGGTIGDAADPANALNGQPYGCFDDGGVYVYYHVLIER